MSDVDNLDLNGEDANPEHNRDENHQVLEIPDISKISRYEQVKAACEYVLRSKGCRSHDNTRSSTDIFRDVKEMFPEQFGEDASKNTFSQYLSRSVRDTDSSINCLGIGRGYYISHVADENIPSEREHGGLDNTPQTSLEAPSQAQSRVQKESLLYPVLESWLVAQGYQSQDVSSGRSLGKWGNPDVAGLSALDAFNGLSIELATIEAKTSLDGWEMWIFEAVSHRRFANRVYFAFPHPEETVAKIPQDMRYYSELYGIGILVLSMENEKYKSLHAGQLRDPLDSDDVEVIEVFSAPYNFVQPKYQLKFCESMGINCLRDLYRWGRE